MTCRSLLLVVLMGAACVGPSARAQDGTAEGTLRQGRWHGSVLGRSESGSFLLLVDESGWVRLELGRGEGPDPLRQQGEGWTVITDTDGGGTRTPWGQEWRPLEADLARFLSVVARELSPIPIGGFATRTLVLPAASPTGLRARMALRSRGRGGPGERVRMRGDGRRAVVITGSRRPGRLELETNSIRKVRYPRRETFVPLWSLADMFTPITEK